MDPTTIVGLVLALASTVLISLAYLREHDAAAGLPPLSLRHPLRSVQLLVRSGDWLRAFAMESTGFGLYVAALALAPLALVQSVAAGGVGVLAFATARFARRRMTRRELLGAGLAVSGLVLLGVSLSGGSVGSSRGSTSEIVIWLVATVAVAALVVSSGRALFGRGVADGIAGGLFFAIGDISTKLVTQGGVRLLFVFPLIGGYLIGTSLLQIGYQSGAALTVAGIATLITNAMPIVAGTVLLHEPVPTGALGVLRVLAFVMVTAGAIVLARPERQPAAEDGEGASAAAVADAG